MGEVARWGLGSKCCKSSSLVSPMEPARVTPWGVEISRVKSRSIGRHCISLAPLSCKSALIGPHPVSPVLRLAMGRRR